MWKTNALISSIAIMLSELKNKDFDIFQLQPESFLIFYAFFGLLFEFVENERSDKKFFIAAFLIMLAWSSLYSAWHFLAFELYTANELIFLIRAFLVVMIFLTFVWATKKGA